MALALGTSILSHSLDSDGDGISDEVETLYGYSPDLASETPSMTLITKFQLNGDDTKTYLSTSAAIAGDVNNDGFVDVMVASYTGSSIYEEAMSVHVFSGDDGAELYTFTGDDAGDYFGSSLASAGDVNNDGYCDIVVGAYLDDNNGTSSGSARVYSGKDGIELYSFYGDSANDYFGVSVSGVGDINKDGFSDVIVGAQGDSANDDASGSAYIYSGKDGAILYTFNGNSAGMRFGSSVAGRGDVDSDGFPDVIIGAAWESSNRFASGSARVYSGKDGTELYTLLGLGINLDYFSYDLGNAGDVNADGYDDVIVGSVKGNAHVFSGKDGSELYYYAPPNSYVDSGLNVSGIGDVNNDGYDDVVVGTGDENTLLQNSGAVHVFSGKDGIELYTFDGKYSGSHFGSSVSGAVNSDGTSSIVVGSWGGDGKGSVTVIATMVDLDSDGLTDEIDDDDDNDGLTDVQEAVLGTNDKSTDSDSDGLNDALEVNTYGTDPNNDDSDSDGILDGDELADLVKVDTDGDGVSDWTETYFGYNPSLSSDAPVMTMLPMHKLEGVSETDGFGFLVAGGEDIDQDGFNDVIVGGSIGTGDGPLGTFTNENGIGVGLYTYYAYNFALAGDVNNDGYPDVIVKNGGSSDIRIYSGKDDSELYVFERESPGYSFNSAVAGAGDVNNDGYDDVIVGVGLFDETQILSRGALIYSGKDGAVLHEFVGSADDHLGTSVAGLGDVNNDGYADVVVGSSNQTHIYSGFNGVELLAFADGKVSRAGDVNNDGYDDVIVGDYRSNRIFSGKDGVELYSFIGGRAAGAGDVNNDGYDDLIIGDYSDNINGISSGSVHIYSGKSGVELFTFSGDAAGEYFGRSVATAGDVNRDGYADVIVGAFTNIANASASGSATLFVSTVDLDGDGLTDELDDDDDGDGLTDGEEEDLGTSGKEADSDGDGLNDGVEVNTHNTDPNKIDSDDDGLTDFKEVAIHNTNPLESDSDADGLLDADEINTYLTDPIKADSDHDGLSDGDELNVHGTNPLEGDSDEDGVKDAVELFYRYEPNLASDTPSIFHSGMFRVTPNDIDSEVIYSQASAGDVNNDGYSDVIVGSYIVGGLSVGGARVFSGKDNEELYAFNGTVEGGRFGFSVAGLGDVDNDGYDDVIVGAAGSSIEGTGSARVFSGFNGAQLYVFNGDITADIAGYSVAWAGDVNGDGHSDIIIGSDGHGGNGTERIYSGKNGLELYTFNNEAEDGQVGLKVSGAGDVNNDGAFDVIVANRYGDDNGIDSGTVRILSGVDGMELFRFYGTAENEHFGANAATAGDVNNDGYSDVIVGSHSEVGEEDGGVVMIFSGYNGRVLFTFFGSVDDHIGRNVSGAGDVNGDGFSDVVVSSYYQYESEAILGRVRIYSGKSGLGIYSFFGNGEDFGRGVVAAGDINGDGVADLIVNEVDGSKGAVLFVSRVDLDGDGIADDIDQDADGDGLTFDEESDIGTNAKMYDTDGDGINDGDEVANNTDPLVINESNGGGSLGLLFLMLCLLLIVGRGHRIKFKALT